MNHPMVMGQGITSVQGKVVDSENGQPVPFVNIIFKNTSIGTISDTTGCFKLQGKIMSDTILLSTIGYRSSRHAIKRGQKNNVTVKLTPDMVALKEVKVAPDDGPMRRLFNQIIKQKPVNNPERHTRYAFEKYSRWEYKINNTGKKELQCDSVNLRDKAMSAMALDTMQDIPLFFSEQIFYNEYQRTPARQKCTILANSKSGLGMLEDTEISGFTSGLDMGVNFYDNQIKILSQNFISPLADNGWFYYKYYLSDSTQINGIKHYNVRFVPRRWGDNVFTGNFIAETHHYSVVDIQAKLTNTSHLNFVRRLEFTASYQFVNDTIPFFKTTTIDAAVDYMPVSFGKNDKRIELNVKHLSSIDKVTLNPPGEVKLSSSKLSYETLKVRGADTRDTAYWKTVRHVGLSASDELTRSRIDSLNQKPFVKFLDKLSYMLFTGYWDLGKWEVGPYDYVFNKNAVEGTHLYIGGRTSTEIWENGQIWGGVGYATRKKEMIWRLGGGYILDSPTRQIIRGSLTDDYIRIGENEKILNIYENKQNTSESNLIAHIFKRDRLDELYRQQKATFEYEHEWRSGFSTRLKASYSKQFSPDFYPFMCQGNPVGSVRVADMGINLRWSWKEKYIDKGFRRLYTGTRYPIVNLNLGGGQSFVNGMNEFYARIHATYKHMFFWGQTQMLYVGEAGAVAGKAPYTILDIPRGNETYGFIMYNYNLMNNLEYVHDTYVHLFLDYHLNGMFFKRFPLIKHLGLREVITFKGLYGTLRNGHTQMLDLPLSISPNNHIPYAEVGWGVENVFRFFRIDAIYRISEVTYPGAPKFGIRGRFEVKF
ncbi:DUF5686 and carboxypeptidase-like regulatory domain-containing protein [Breznakibacter xylanolyticus]|nr:DUF5686 and carboxypeptidase-like regulatory domain-containing protein [Breznakibacter xylanolyticus]